MKRLLSRGFRVTALVGVTLALAACSAQTPERETGSTIVPGTETSAVQVIQPVTVGSAGVTRVVIPTQDLAPPAPQTTANAGVAIQQTTTVTTPAVEDASTLIVGPT